MWWHRRSPSRKSFASGRNEAAPVVSLEGHSGRNFYFRLTKSNRRPSDLRGNNVNAPVLSRLIIDKHMSYYGHVFLFKDLLTGLPLLSVYRFRYIHTTMYIYSTRSYMITYDRFIQQYVFRLQSVGITITTITATIATTATILQPGTLEVVRGKHHLRRHSKWVCFRNEFRSILGDIEFTRPPSVSLSLNSHQCGDRIDTLRQP